MDSAFPEGKAGPGPPWSQESNESSESRAPLVQGAASPSAPVTFDTRLQAVCFPSWFSTDLGPAMKSCQTRTSSLTAPLEPTSVLTFPVPERPSSNSSVLFLCQALTLRHAFCALPVFYVLA